MTGSAPDPLANLLSTSYPPAFVHLHHPHHPTTAITPLSGNDQDGRTRRYAQVDLIELSTPKLLYSAIVHRLAGASTSESRANGGENREVSTWDDFAIRLREVLGGQKAPGHARRKIAGGASADSGMDKADQAVVMITHAERLRTILGPRWAAMTRIRELSGLPITLITASHQTWDHLRPFAADAPEPVHVYLPALSRNDLLSSLTPRQNLISAAEPTADDLSNPFVTGSTSTTKTGHPLWPHFCNLLLATFSHLAPTSAELSYIAEPLWVLYTANLPPHAEQDLLRTSRHTATTTSNGTSGTSIVAPLDITVKLLTDLKYAISPAFTNASESLLSGTVGRTSFLSSLMPTSALTGDLDNPLAGPSKRTLPRAPSLTLPYIAKFLLIASYLASQNPPRTDLRLFGRGLTVEGKRKKGGGTRRAGYGRVKVGKVPQRLVGPKPFPLERGLAIWSALYAENGRRPMDLEQDDAFSGSEDEDIEDRLGEEDGTDAAGPPTPSKRRHGANSAGFILPALPGSTTKARRIRDEDWMYSRAERESKRAERKRKRQIEKEERWEEYVEEMSMSVALWGLVPDLEAQGLIKRVSPAERLDNVQLRCEIGYEAAVGLAKEVGITLDEYLYEAQA